ncbi:MAG TPA: hypothetical protein VMN57_11030 [Anaerolineales bacterium]|nr:hypothetical protein [Anaerolineales bacterium]
MNKSHLLFLFTVLVSFLLTACSTPAAASGSENLGKGPVSTGQAACPVTQPPAEPFVPPKPWPETYPYAGRVWYGSAGLWTALPEDGEWRQLLYGDKFWWWSEEFDVEEDSTPNLVISARRLDGKAPEVLTDEATNGYHDSFNWAMLMGLTVETPGCWEITGEYAGHTLSIVVWIPAE